LFPDSRNSLVDEPVKSLRLSPAWVKRVEAGISEGTPLDGVRRQTARYVQIQLLDSALSNEFEEAKE
jgi:hypothetical protein